MVDYTLEKEALETIEFNWGFLDILRDYLTDVDIIELKLRDVQDELRINDNKPISGHTELIDEEAELLSLLVNKYRRVRQVMAAISEMDGASSKFLLDYLLTPGLTVYELSKMYGIHRQKAKRMLDRYGKTLKSGTIQDLKLLVDDFEAHEIKCQ